VQAATAVCDDDEALVTLALLARRAVHRTSFELLQRHAAPSCKTSRALRGLAAGGLLLRERALRRQASVRVFAQLCSTRNRLKPQPHRLLQRCLCALP